MDIKDIKQLIQMIETSAVTEIEVEDKGFKVRISRQQAPAAPAPAAPAPVVAQFTAPAPQQLSSPPFPVAAPAPVAEEGVLIIKSPMVGTFYSAPSPESDAFVKVGSQVKETSVVCIIEAMKVMNEIQAELSGRVVEVLASSGQSVEYGQPLFKVKKA